MIFLKKSINHFCIQNINRLINLVNLVATSKKKKVCIKKLLSKLINHKIVTFENKWFLKIKKKIKNGEI